jgi:hypothetical protein
MADRQTAERGLGRELPAHVQRVARAQRAGFDELEVEVELAGLRIEDRLGQRDGARGHIQRIAGGARRAAAAVRNGAALNGPAVGTDFDVASEAPPEAAVTFPVVCPPLASAALTVAGAPPAVTATPGSDWLR